jgi:tetratricopeptide (TPR) repeat protein
MKYIKHFLVLSAIYLSTAVLADTTTEFDDSLLQLQQSWASVNYEYNGVQQEKFFENLITEAEKLTTAYPEQAETWVWRGIIESSYAGAKGGLGALSLAKAAKKSLEKALEIDEQALKGSAYTSLGTLYHKVPGWPIGFGDDDDAKEMLSKALAMNPDGIDPNYFYGEYLYDERDYKQALVYLEKAKQATPREMRPLADKYRHEEIELLLAKVNKKLKR